MTYKTIKRIIAAVCFTVSALTKQIFEKVYKSGENTGNAFKYT